MSQTRSRSRSAARLAAVQALYQQEMEGTPLPRLLKEFHDHRLGATIEDARYHQAEQDCFDDIVTGVDARRAEIDGLISGRLAEGWTLERLDRPMRAILRAGAYELIARPDVPVGSVISEYVDVAHAFYDKRESGFVNGLLDDVAVLEGFVVTHDSIAEGIHFLPHDPPASVGWKLVTVNLSDLAAKGATPAGALLSLTICGEGDWEEAFLGGVEAACESY